MINFANTVSKEGLAVADPLGLPQALLSIFYLYFSYSRVYCSTQTFTCHNRLLATLVQHASGTSWCVYLTIAFWSNVAFEQQLPKDDYERRRLEAYFPRLTDGLLTEYRANCAACHRWRRSWKAAQLEAPRIPELKWKNSSSKDKAAFSEDTFAQKTGFSNREVWRWNYNMRTVINFA